MAYNLVETIQKNLGLPQLQKIDPNIQDAKQRASRQPKEKLAQAVIPGVLTALYNFTRSDEGCEQILARSDRRDWLATLFAGKEEMAVGKVAAYAGMDKQETGKLMENVANEAVSALKKEAGPNAGIEGIRATMNSQRHTILVHLPAAMQMGDLLNEETLDDRTNKMEGPVSNWMHKIENILSEGDQSKYP